MKSKSIKSWFFIVLLITVIAYLSIKPESFKSFNEGFDEGLDISKNIIYTYGDTYDTESDEESESEPEKEKTKSSYSTYIEPEKKDKDWFNFDTYTAAEIAFISIVFVLFLIILFLLSKL